MKNSFSRILVLSLIASCLFIPLQVMASSAEINAQLIDYSEESLEISSMTDEILGFVNPGCIDENIARSAIASDISYENAVKLYMDTNIFVEENLSSTELNEYQSKTDYMWLVPIFVDNSTIIVNISKGLPLNKEEESNFTSEEIQEINSKSGKWTVAAAYTYPEHVNYQQIAISTLTNADLKENISSMAFFGGTKGIRTLIAIASTSEESYVVPLQSTIDINASSSKGIDTFTLDKGNIYSFSEVKENIDIKENEDKNEYITTGLTSYENTENNYSNVLFLIASAIVIVGIASIIIIKKGKGSYEK